MTWHENYSQITIYLDNKNLDWLAHQVEAGDFRQKFGEEALVDEQKI